MESNRIVSKCIAEYDRLIVSVNDPGANGNIELWDGCEESTTTMLAELNELLKMVSPSLEFQSLFKKIHGLNSLAIERVASCEQSQRENKKAQT